MSNFLLSALVIASHCRSSTGMGPGGSSGSGDSGISNLVYINANAPGVSPDGAAWATAYLTLEDALDANPDGATFYIAQGRYTPASDTARDACRAISTRYDFYGGFLGDDSDETIETRQDPLPETIFDADIGVEGDIADNCYHHINMGETLKANFDGIVFENGYAMSDGDGWDENGWGSVIALSDDSGNQEVTFTDCTFRNNYARQGGVLYANEANTLIIETSSFLNNQAIAGSYLGGYGGAIFITSGGLLNISDSVFENNTATYRGGALYGDYGCKWHLSGCTLDSNSVTAGHGGALFMEDRNSQIDGGTVLYLSDSDFTGNSAFGYGGAICLFNGPFGSFDTVSFYSNTAQLGGAITNFDDIVYYEYVAITFSGNVATLDASTNNVYEDEFIDVDTLASEPNLETNSVATYLEQLYDNYAVTAEYNELRAASGSIFYVNENSPCSSSCDGSSWSKAYDELQDCLSAMSSGDEVWVAAGVYKPNEKCSWCDQDKPASYSFNVPEGVALYGGFAGGEGSRSARNFEDNPTYLSCQGVGNSQTTRNCSQILQAAKDVIVDGFIFEGSRTTNNLNRRRMQQTGGVYTTTESAVITSTSSGRGGGVFSNGTNIVIVNSIFTNIIATKGGGMYCIGYDGPDSTAAPTMVNVVFSGITATRGGAIAGDVDCHFICDHCAMMYNRAVEKGGAIYLDYDCDPTLNNTYMIGNEAEESGGCIAADGGSEVFMKDGVFANNSAEWEAGCLYSGSHKTTAPQGFTLVDPTFSHNDAPFGHDDIWVWLAATVTVTETDNDDTTGTTDNAQDTPSTSDTDNTDEGSNTESPVNPTEDTSDPSDPSETSDNSEISATSGTSGMPGSSDESDESETATTGEGGVGGAEDAAFSLKGELGSFEMCFALLTICGLILN